jgi:cytochrome c oxidase cbb3-type subunit 3
MLAKQNLDKTKTPKVIPGALLIVLLLFVQFASAQDAGTADAVKEVVAKGPGLPTLYYVMFFVLGAEIAIIAFLTYMIKQLSYELLPDSKKKIASESKLKIWWANLGKKMTNAVPLEKEADVVMDHEYDGIRELDNALPPWWKYGFYITIAFSVCYFFYFSVFGYGKNPTEEYNAEMAKAKIEIEKFEATNKDKIDEKNVPMADASGLAKAKAIYEVKCFACHGKLGEGGAGPNLTDNYWLHNGSLNDIYLSIKHGYPDKGMQAWASVYNPKEISELASYIMTLKGTNPPNGKAPQGDLYVGSDATPVENTPPAEK